MKISNLLIISLFISLRLMSMELEKPGYSSEEGSWKDTLRRSVKKKEISMIKDLDEELYSSGSTSMNSHDVEDNVEIDIIALAEQFFGIKHTGKERYIKNLTEHW